MQAEEAPVVAAPNRGRGATRSQSMSWEEQAGQLWRYRYLYLMLIPPFIYFFAFRFYPLLGNVMAFKNYRLNLGIWGSPWVGLDQFKALFGDEIFMRALWNTVAIGVEKLVFVFPSAIILAIFLNEITWVAYKSVLQTVVYAPYFLSWVIYAAILYLLLSARNDGMMNNILVALGFPRVAFFNTPGLFQPIVIISSILKESGWAAVIYLAAISAIDTPLYEAAVIDGANRWQLIRHVTLPGISTTIMTLLILQLGWFLSVGFIQVFILQNNIVLTTGDIIETFIYRVGIQQARFDYTTAAGLFNSTVGMFLVLISDWVAKRMGLQGIL